MNAQELDFYAKKKKENTIAGVVTNMEALNLEGSEKDTFNSGNLVSSTVAASEVCISFGDYEAICVGLCWEMLDCCAAQHSIWEQVKFDLFLSLLIIARNKLKRR